MRGEVLSASMRTANRRKRGSSAMVCPSNCVSGLLVELAHKVTGPRIELAIDAVLPGVDLGRIRRDLRLDGVPALDVREFYIADGERCEERGAVGGADGAAAQNLRKTRHV